MKTLLKNASVVNVFTGDMEQVNVLIEDDRIIGVGDYADNDAEQVEDLTGKYLCPGFIDGHIHIESTLLTPAEFAKVCVPHGTTSVVADPHEIANVCGIQGIRYMLEASQGLPLHVYLMLPSCVPSTHYDESGATLNAKELEPLYSHERVIGLAEVMNYSGVLFGDVDLSQKLKAARERGLAIDGHAPLVSGRELDKYISAGIQSDHECTNIEEAIERVRKGQWVMIRQGTAAHNLQDLLPLFDDSYRHRCLLVTDDCHPADLINHGHIDHIIRLAVQAGKSVITAIQMATIQCAQCFGLKYVGAIAPGYRADILVLDDLDTVAIRDVYSKGKKVVANGLVTQIAMPVISQELQEKVHNSFCLDAVTADDFYIEPKSNKCRVIEIVPGQLLTNEIVEEIDWTSNNGIDLEKDILKLAVVERHANTGHKGLGFITGIGLKQGAIAASVSHDSHNLIVIGTNDEDMAVATNYIREIGGGGVIVVDGKVVAEMPLPIAGLMTDIPAKEIAERNAILRNKVHELGAPHDVAPFMNMAFVSLLVIPSIKMSTQGLFDVNSQQILSLYL